jgi:hypothetical protein
MSISRRGGAVWSFMTPRRQHLSLVPVAVICTFSPYLPMFVQASRHQPTLRRVTVGNSPLRLNEWAASTTGAAGSPVGQDPRRVTYGVGRCSSFVTLCA